MRYLTFTEIIELHHRIIQQSGGAAGVRELGGIQAALSQPQMTFAGRELYATLEAKAAALCFSLVGNHPFVDGNKRIGHAAMEVFLVLNGFELSADVAEAETVFLKLAAGELAREELVSWITAHLQPLRPPSAES